jgi:hypothetical protein
MSGFYKRGIMLMEGNNSILSIFGGAYSKLLLEILHVMDRNLNRFYSNKETRSKIVKRLKITEISYQRRLRWLVDKKVLVRAEGAGRGVYYLNRELLRFN